jgi:hypothetical protein
MKEGNDRVRTIGIGKMIHELKIPKEDDQKK